MVVRNGENGKVDPGTAADLMTESFGLTADDLGMHNDEAFTGDDDAGGDDLSEGGEDINLRGGNQEGDGDGDDGDFLSPTPAPQQQQQRQPVDPAQGQQPRVPPGKYKRDGKGNVLDANNKIVARAGAEARLWGKAQQAQHAYQGAQAALADVNGRLNKAVDLGQQLYDGLKAARQEMQEVKSYGLDMNEVKQALGFAKEAKTNPIGVLKTLLTRAAADGIDLTQLGLAKGAIDPNAFMSLVRDQITTAMTPLQQRQQQDQERERQQQEETQRATEANRELNSFLTSNPDARPYLPVFKAVYEQPQFQHMTLGEVWARVQLNLIQRQRAGGGNQRQSPNRGQNQPLPRSNGRRFQQPQGRSGQEDIAPVNTSYEDIIRGIL